MDSINPERISTSSLTSVRAQSALVESKKTIFNYSGTKALLKTALSCKAGYRPDEQDWCLMFDRQILQNQCFNVRKNYNTNTKCGTKLLLTFETVVPFLQTKLDTIQKLHWRDVFHLLWPGHASDKSTFSFANTEE